MASKIFSVLFVIFHSFPLYQLELSENSITKQNDNTTTTEIPMKFRTLYDYQTHMVAFKDLVESRCILENLNGGESVINKWNTSGRRNSISKNLLHNELLSKRQIYRLAGDRITEFCRGFPTYLIKNEADISDNTYLNDLPNVISKQRDKRSSSHNFHRLNIEKQMKDTLIQRKLNSKKILANLFPMLNAGTKTHRVNHKQFPPCVFSLHVESCVFSRRKRFLMAPFLGAKRIM